MQEKELVMEYPLRQAEQTDLSAAHFWQWVSEQGSNWDVRLLNPKVSATEDTVSHVPVPAFLNHPLIHWLQAFLFVAHFWQ